MFERFEILIDVVVAIGLIFVGDEWCLGLIDMLLEAIVSKRDLLVVDVSTPEITPNNIVTNVSEQIVEVGLLELECDRIVDYFVR